MYKYKQSPSIKHADFNQIQSITPTIQSYNFDYSEMIRNKRNSNQQRHFENYLKLSEEKETKFKNYLSNALSFKFDIIDVYFVHDEEEDHKVVIFKVGDKSAEEISNLSLKLRKEAYFYSKNNDLLEPYNEFIFLLRR